MNVLRENEMTEGKIMENFQSYSSEATSWEAFIKEEEIEIKQKGGHSPQKGVTLRDQHSRGKDLRGDTDDEEDSSQKLPRCDVALYGIYPKIDGRVLSICVGCKGVFHPQHIKEHTCATRTKVVLPQSLKKKVKSKKKSQQSPLPPPPIFQDPISPSTSTKTPEVPLTIGGEKINTTESFEGEPVVSTTVPPQIIATTVELPPSTPVIVNTPTFAPQPISREEVISTTTSTTVTVACSTGFASQSAVTVAGTGTTTGTINGSSSSSTSSSSRHKKSKKNKIPKEYNADVHCGVIDSKGICMRSITCSNHRLQQRKLVVGRTKDIHQLIAEKKATKEKDGSNSQNDEPESARSNNYVPLLTSSNHDKEVVKKASTYVSILSKTVENNNDPSTKSKTTTSLSSNIGLHSDTHNDVKFEHIKNVDDGYHSTNSQEVAVSSPNIPVVYMPMSPVSVVSPLQLVQIGNNMVCIESPQPALSPPLPNQSFLWKMPDQIPNMKIYKSHPKPAALPTFGAKKIGGAIILSNQRLESQFNDIQVAIATKRKASNNATNYKVSVLNNTPHRPNILKVKNKNCKRPSTDKIISSDSKQIRLAPDVNGFILHSDMSEAAEAPQSNNSIQEKIALLNMK